MNLKLNRKHAALMVVDFQERLLPAILNKDFMLERAKLMISVAKILDLPIFATEQYPQGLGHTSPDVLDLLEDRPVFAKTSFSAYTDEVKEHLETLGRKQVILIGAESHICVFQTARDLRLAGYEVFFAEDAISARTEANRQNGFSLMRQAQAVHSNTETMIYDLLERAATDEFKAVLKYIK